MAIVEWVPAVHRWENLDLLLTSEWEWGDQDEPTTVVGVAIEPWFVWVVIEADQPLLAFAENDSQRRIDLAGKSPAEKLSLVILSFRPNNLPVRYAESETGQLCLEVDLIGSGVPGQTLTFAMPDQCQRVS